MDSNPDVVTTLMLSIFSGILISREKIARIDKHIEMGPLGFL